MSEEFLQQALHVAGLASSIGSRCLNLMRGRREENFDLRAERVGLDRALKCVPRFNSPNHRPVVDALRKVRDIANRIAACDPMYALEIGTELCQASTQLREAVRGAPTERADSLSWLDQRPSAPDASLPAPASDPNTAVAPALDDIFVRAREREAAREAESRSREEAASRTQSIVELYVQLALWHPSRLAPDLGHWPTREEEHSLYARLVARICQASRDAGLALRPPSITPNSDGEHKALEILHLAFKNDTASIERILRLLAEISPGELGNQTVGALLRILRYEVLGDLQIELDRRLGKESLSECGGGTQFEAARAEGEANPLSADAAVNCPDCGRPFSLNDATGRMGCQNCQIELASETDNYPSAPSFLDLKLCFVRNPDHPNESQLDDLQDWPAIQHFACELFRHPTFSADTLTRLEGWLKFKRPRTEVLSIPLTGVAGMLRAETEGHAREAERECASSQTETDNRDASETAVYPILHDSPPNVPSAVTPRWDPDKRELWFGAILCKRFRRPAPNQERILGSFSESDWPARIDDPTPPGKLAATIRHLNEGLEKNAPIHFGGDGTGKGILWDICPRRAVDAP